MKYPYSLSTLHYYIDFRSFLIYNIAEFIGGHMRNKANVSAYLCLEVEGKLVFLLRQNTGYMDGFWGLISGHQEAGESVTQAMIREAKEEAGITIAYEDLEVVHVMHRKTERENVDVFFSCKKFSGEIVNMEPEKCASVGYFEPNRLPENIMDYVFEAIEFIQEGVSFSELGWEESELASV